MRHSLILCCVLIPSLSNSEVARADEDIRDWYPFTATGLVHQDSVISLADWLPKPAGFLRGIPDDHKN